MAIVEPLKGASHCKIYHLQLQHPGFWISVMHGSGMGSDLPNVTLIKDHNPIYDQDFTWTLSTSSLAYCTYISSSYSHFHALK